MNEQNKVWQSDTSIPEYSWLTKLGMCTVSKVLLAKAYLNFFGELVYRLIFLIRHPKRFRIKPFLNQIDLCGFQALPIVALLTFLIGVVLTYQMGTQLKLYGANIFVVDLIGLSVLREFGPLITAILVIGRTGSAFTAQLGTMKINQEMDALSVIGVAPFDMLVIPRVLGLLVALPLLTVWSDIFGVFGGMCMSKMMLHIQFADFLVRFQEAVSVKQFLIGIAKTPVFALIISLVGCFRGFRVSHNAQSVGYHTTKSVVQAIFLIIIADAAFSILFSWMGL